jgi:hypothetical protein
MGMHFWGLQTLVRKALGSYPPWGISTEGVENHPDTVGELKSADICVSHMPSLKAKKLGKLPREKVLLER